MVMQHMRPVDTTSSAHARRQLLPQRGSGCEAVVPSTDRCPAFGPASCSGLHDG